MRSLGGIAALLALAGCGDTAWNTTVADNMAVRAQMAGSVEPGRTTEAGLVSRWGPPVQRLREGGQVLYVYRRMRDAGEDRPSVTGDSAHFVVVTFQYGIATGVSTSETMPCRASFPPRPRWYPITYEPSASCPGLLRPPVGRPVLPPEGAAPEPEGASDYPTSLGPDAGAAGTDWPPAEPIPDDVYVGDPSKGK